MRARVKYELGGQPNSGSDSIECGRPKKPQPSRPPWIYTRLDPYGIGRPHTHAGVRTAGGSFRPGPTAKAALHHLTMDRHMLRSPTASPYTIQSFIRNPVQPYPSSTPEPNVTYSSSMNSWRAGFCLTITAPFCVGFASQTSTRGPQSPRPAASSQHIYRYVFKWFDKIFSAAPRVTDRSRFERRRLPIEKCLPLHPRRLDLGQLT